MRKIEIIKNSNCPCGSGKLCIDCCYKLSLPELKQKISEVDKNNYNYNKCCVPHALKENCSNIIAECHTVSQNSLKNICSENNTQQILYYFHKGRELYNENGYKLSTIPLTKASTRRIFCTKHDNTLFDCFENKAFHAGNDQIFFLNFRSLVHRYSESQLACQRDQFAQLLSIKQIPLLEHTYISYPEIQPIYSWKLSLEKEVDLFHKLLISKNYNSIKYICIRYEKVFPIQCSETALININDNTKLKPFFINSFYDNVSQYSYIVFSWINVDNSINKHIGNFLFSRTNNAVFNFYVLFFQLTDNLYISPEWWENLPLKFKDLLVELLENNNSSDNFLNEILHLIKNKPLITDYDNYESLDNIG